MTNNRDTQGLSDRFTGSMRIVPSENIQSNRIDSSLEVEFAKTRVFLEFIKPMITTGQDLTQTVYEVRGREYDAVQLEQLKNDPSLSSRDRKIAKDALESLNNREAQDKPMTPEERDMHIVREWMP